MKILKKSLILFSITFLFFTNYTYGAMTCSSSNFSPVSFPASGNTATPTVSLPTPVPQGALIVLGFYNRTDSTTVVNSVSDSVNGANGWMLGSQNSQGFFYYRLNSSPGTMIITANLSAAINSQMMAGWCSDDSGSLSYNTSAPVSSFSGTNANSNSISSSGGGGIIGFLTSNNSSNMTTVGSNELTLSGYVPFQRAHMFFEPYSSVGTYGFQTTSSGAISGGFHVLSFLSSGVNTPPSPPSDTTPPTISSISVSNITTTGATITYTTNESVTSQVQYGLSTSYGSTQSSGGTNSHSVTLSNLTPNTTYSYRISATDSANNNTLSTNQTFTTSAVVVTPPTPPVTPSTETGTNTANYPLQIIQPQPNLSVSSRYYKAYPGIEYKVPVGVFGGAFPFTYSLVTAPSGMMVDPNSGVITWPNPTTSGSPHNVSVRVTDATGATAIRSWTITVTTTGFIFIDANNGVHAQGFGCTTSCGTGTLTNPFRSMNDVYRTGADPIWRNTTFVDQFIYWRAGTYGLEGYFENSGQQYQIEWRGNQKPKVWLAYPGETVVIDHNLTPGSNGAFLDFRDGNSDDTYIQGIRFIDALNHNIRTVGNRMVFFENSFENLGVGLDGHNTSFIMFASSGSPGTSLYNFVKNNRFTNGNTTAYVKTYSLGYALFEGNQFTSPVGSNEGLALKGNDRFVEVRSNTFDGNFDAGSISGNWNGGGNFEIRFNNIKNAGINSNSQLYGGLTVNHDGTTNFPVYIYRNTIEGIIMARAGVTGNGPFYIYNNVIINDNSGIPTGSHFTHYQVSDPSVFILNNNLVGYSSNNIIDNNGNLTSGYLSYLGIAGHQFVSGSAPTPTPTPPPTTPPTVVTPPTPPTTPTTPPVSGGGSSPAPSTPSTPSTGSAAGGGSAPAGGGVSLPTTPTQPSTPTTNIPKPTLTRTVYLGSKGSDVTSLQTFLISTGYLSPNLNTGYYGNQTKLAVQKYQCATLKLCSGSESTNGYGIVGAKTRATFTTTPTTSQTTTTTTLSTEQRAVIQKQISDLLIIVQGLMEQLKKIQGL